MSLAIRWLTVSISAILASCLITSPAVTSKTDTSQKNGFTPGSSVSISFREVCYVWTGQPIQVDATVMVSGTAEPDTPGDVSVSGPGAIDPASFPLPNGGSKSITVTLPAEPGAYSYTASISRHVSDDPHGHEMFTSLPTTVYVVKAGALEYQQANGNYIPVPNPLTVAIGSTVSFKVTKDPQAAPSWPSGKPVWSGTAPNASGTGETKSITFSTAGTYTLTAECGNTLTPAITIIVVELDKIQYSKEGVYLDVPDTLYVAIGDSVTFKAIPNPATASWPAGDLPEWSYNSTTSTGETTTVTFETAGNTTVSAEYHGETVTVNVTVVEITRLQYAIGQGTYQDVPESLNVPVGSVVSFKAIKNPASATWPDGTPTWSSNTGASGTGETKTITFSSAGVAEVTALCGTSGATASLLVYTVEILSAPTICAGAKTDDVHQGTIRAKVGADGIGIKDINVTFALGNLRNDTILNPTLVLTTGTTDDDGIAEVTVKSGKGVLDGSSIEAPCVTVTPSINGITGTGADITVMPAALNITLTDPSTGEEISSIVTHGGEVNVNAVLDFDGTPVKGHQISLYVKFFTTEQADPDTAQALFNSDVDGLTSATDDDDECETKHTLYGKLSSNSGTTGDDGTYTITYTSGSQEGKIYFFVKDLDTFTR